MVQIAYVKAVCSSIKILMNARINRYLQVPSTLGIQWVPTPTGDLAQLHGACLQLCPYCQRAGYWIHFGGKVKQYLNAEIPVPGYRYRIQFCTRVPRCVCIRIPVPGYPCIRVRCIFYCYNARSMHTIVLPESWVLDTFGRESDVCPGTAYPGTRICVSSFQVPWYLPTIFFLLRASSPMVGTTPYTGVAQHKPSGTGYCTVQN